MPDGEIIDPELLEILACPETKEDVSLAPPEVLQALNERLRAGELRTRGGEPVEEELVAGLLRKDGRILYPVRDGIPIMLVDESIEV